jgi:hypothetical protein
MERLREFRSRGSDAAAGYPCQHQSDQPSSAATDAAAALGEAGLCPVRQYHRGRKHPERGGLPKREDIVADGASAFQNDLNEQ